MLLLMCICVDFDYKPELFAIYSSQHPSSALKHAIQILRDSLPLVNSFTILAVLEQKEFAYLFVHSSGNVFSLQTYN